MTKLFRAAIFRRVAVVIAGLLLAAIALGFIPFWLRRLFSSPQLPARHALLDGYRHTEVASVSDAMEKVTGQKNVSFAPHAADLHFQVCRICAYGEVEERREP